MAGDECDKNMVAFLLIFHRSPKCFAAALVLELKRRAMRLPRNIAILIAVLKTDRFVHFENFSHYSKNSMVRSSGWADE
jgi:hypothetical protein